jgi:hypothetical protein
MPSLTDNKAGVHGARYPSSLLRGTEGSNPVPSSSESSANLTSARSTKKAAARLGVDQP